jgi:hypothetical protein
VEESDSYDVNLADVNESQEAQDAEDALALQRLNRDLGSAQRGVAHGVQRQVRILIFDDPAELCES